MNRKKEGGKCFPEPPTEASRPVRLLLSVQTGAAGPRPPGPRVSPAPCPCAQPQRQPACVSRGARNRHSRACWEPTCKPVVSEGGACRPWIHKGSDSVSPQQPHPTHLLPQLRPTPIPEAPAKLLVLALLAIRGGTGRLFLPFHGLLPLACEALGLQVSIEKGYGESCSSRLLVASVRTRIGRKIPLTPAGLMPSLCLAPPWLTLLDSRSSFLLARCSALSSASRCAICVRTCCARCAAVSCPSSLLWVAEGRDG